MSAATPIVVLAGPTGSGKTALALALARTIDAELVGADSIQVYRGFDIGSAKPIPDELQGITHHLLDVVDADEAIDAMRYAGLADAAIESASRRGKPVIVVGGTGLWIRALVRGLVDLPAVDPVIRERLESEARDGSLPLMHSRLAIVDPRSAAGIHPNDALRIVRALEVHAQTGTPLGELRAHHALGAPRRPTLFVALEPPLDVLTRRIDARVDAMIAGGWVEEVRALRARWSDSVRALGSVGYREWVSHLRDELAYDDTVREVKHSTRVYARRQRNWFRAEPGIDLRLTSDDASPESAYAATIDLVRRQLAR